MFHLRKLTAIFTQLALVAVFTFSATAAKSNGRDAITQEDLKEWLTYLASDELEGRNTYTEGLGLAAGYIAERLRSWGVKPGGPNGSYFQRVAVLGVKSDNNSTITVEANGQTRTFKNKEGINFPSNVGGKQTLTRLECARRIWITLRLETIAARGLVREAPASSRCRREPHKPPRTPVSS